MGQETLDCDIVIVGAGPAGLSAAITCKQLRPDWQICILEKGAEIGSHILSGAVFDPIALNELLPDWQTRHAPVNIVVSQENFLYLTQKYSFNLPYRKKIPALNHQGHYLIRLGSFCRWLAKQAEALGVDIYTGFSATAFLTDQSGHITGVKTGDKGKDKQGNMTGFYQPSIAIRAKCTVLAEGVRGYLSQQVIQRFALNKYCDRQQYILGVKELWQISAEHHQPGNICHTLGWPLDRQTYGGGFMYHIDQGQLAIGFATEFNQADSFEKLQQLKSHPSIKPLFKHAKQLGYGAKLLSEGGLQSLPKLNFPGGVLIGDAAGFLNVAKLQGIHTAMKSGMLAAESMAEAVLYNKTYIKKTWLFRELYQARNIRPSFQWGLWSGLFLSGLSYFFQGREPWTIIFKNKNKNKNKNINFVINNIKINAVYFSAISYAEQQPNHLHIQPEITDFFSLFHCPATVYRLENKNLVLSPQNCLHCKACDTVAGVTWTLPEGGSGPNYMDL